MGLSLVRPLEARIASAEKERAVVEQLPVVERLAFLGTNVGYWVVAAMMVVWHYTLGASEHGWPCSLDQLGDFCHAVCFGRVGGIPAVPALLMVAVATASTAMHTAQMRLCPTCLFTAAQVKWCHEPRTVAALRKLDVSCVLVVLVAGGSCVGWVNAVGFLAYVFPLHVLSIFARLRGHGRAYLHLHGLWHLGSAYGIYRMLKPP
eukprot:m.476921 g.476921  ORF g.476921 m.476921 type:complete len:205 (+) comp42158_c0_seq1:126-740(+)